MAPRLVLDPPLLNAACPWASDLSFLRPLFASPSTGAITTRTALVNGYPHDDAKNTFLFYDPASGAASTRAPAAFPADADSFSGSLNCFGLSPHILETYCAWLRTLAAENPGSDKLVVVSVTGETPETNAAAVRRVLALADEIPLRLAVEINLSCPNVPGVPPPAYDAAQLDAFIAAIPAHPAIPVGLKTTPYTHPGQFDMLVSAVARAGDKISFITATNTLGNCTIYGADGPGPILPSEGGFGGLAGPAIHPLALGNVATLRRMLDAADLGHIDIIGVGGVSDAAGYERMRAAGAAAVGVATALGRQGVAVFDRIAEGTRRKRGARL